MTASSSSRISQSLRLSTLGVIAFALALAWCSSASAYVPIRTPQGAVVRWTQLPIHWFYNHNGFNQMTANQVLSVFLAAFQKWEAPGCTGIKFKFGGTTQLRWNTQDNRNVLIWNPNIPDPNFPTALALTIPYYTPNGIYLDSDIIFNGSYQWSLNPAGNQFDIMGTSTHEIGHFFGLDHTPVRDATMFATASPGLCPCRTLKQDDINAVCALYPGNGPGTSKRQLGQPCDQANVCDQGMVCLVYQQGDTTGVCHKTCPNGTCLSGEKCFQLGNGSTACACNGDADCSNGKGCKAYFCNGQQGGGTTKTRKFGEACDPNHLCVDGFVCVQYQQGTQTGVCHTACPTDTCTNGEKCYTLTNQSKACVCQNDKECSGGKKCQNYMCVGGGNTGGAEGKPCDAQGNCQTGLQCLQDGNQSLCVRPCRSNADCVNGGECSAQFQICVPKPPPGTQNKGEACDPQNACKAGLACIVVQQGANSGICLPTCPNGTCAGGEKCTKLENGWQVCACAQNEQCPAGKGCKNYQCETLPNPSCTNDSNCPTGQMCQNGQCVNRGNCQNNTQCPPGTTCQNGSCVTVPTPGATCVPNCSPGFDCINGRCVFRDECKTDAECSTSEQCKQGVCHPRPSTTPRPDLFQPPTDNGGCNGCRIGPNNTHGTPSLPIGLLALLLIFANRMRRK